MKIRLSLFAVLAGLLTLNAEAQDNPRRPGGPGGGGRGRGPAPTAEEIKTHDKNSDGKLEGEELTALREARQKAMLEKYDADKDGKLNEEERKKMEAENPRRFGPGGPGGQPTAEEIKTHDKNGDGKLEGEEVTALREARQKAFLEKYDADKDGKLSDEERRKAMQDRPRGSGEGSGRRPRPGAGEGEGEKKSDAPKVPTPEAK